MKIKKGDTVKVIAGKDRGKTGKVVRAFPKEGKVLVEGVNVVKKHRRSTGRTRSGQIVDKALPIHASNVQMLDAAGKVTRIRVKREKGSRTRVAATTGATL